MKNFGAVLPPLGLAYIASAIEKEGHKVKIIDGPAWASKEGYGFEELEKDIASFEPDVVGVSMSASQIPFGKEAMEMVKKISPNSLLILGGPLITSAPEMLNEFNFADYGVYGEADLTFAKILEKIKNNEKLNGVEGVIWREEKEIKFLKPNVVRDLDEIPMPAWHLLRMEIYAPSPANYRRLPATTMMTSRGCPYKCTFCSRPIEGTSFRYHSAKRVVDEIEHLIKEYNIKDIQMFDDTFTLIPKRTEDICNEIIKRELDIGWNCMTRVDRVDEDLFRLMKKAGCYEVGFGIESGSERILKFIKKDLNKDQIKQGVKWAKNAGIDVRGFFMMGFPTETKEEIKQTIKFAKKLNVDVAQFMITTPLPGTEMWEMAQKHGEIDDDWQNFTFYAPENLPFKSDTITNSELLGLYKWAYRSYYLRPRFILRQLMKLKSTYDIKRNWLAAKGILGI